MAAAPTALILAAGQGTRMRSATPKLLHDVLGRPLVAWPIAAARAAGCERIVAVVSPDDALGDVLGDAQRVVQPRSDGTGGAVRAASDVIADAEEVLVLSGDVPLLDAGTIEQILHTHRSRRAAATIVTMTLDDPGYYGRVVRDSVGDVQRVAEAKEAGDATPRELAIREVNAGTYVFNGAALIGVLGQLRNDNAQGEYYLPDALPLLLRSGKTVAAHALDDPELQLGVNTQVDLSEVNAVARRRVLEAHMLTGVRIVDPASTWIDVDVAIEPDARIEPGTVLAGQTSVGRNSVIGPHSTLRDARIGSGVQIPHSYLTSCRVADGATVGPFAYLRPDTSLREKAKAGAFVEIKNSVIGPEAKVPHLSYIGDTDVGQGANLGAGTITANYDGQRKHRTRIGDGVRTGVDTALVAPVSLGDHAYTGAGSVIDTDVPEGALGIARSRQKNVEGYAERRVTRAEEEDRR
ncbi:MAG: bifunctional UDP-N-acetylglucosamine diphosphorylase/glucosamine-1-phosphate N-acetyltransferase GlmU [Solirubrobacterales bacterium]